MRLKSDSGTYVKGENEGVVYLVLYVDNLFLGKEIQRIKEVKRELNKEFKTKDLGEARFLLGIEIKRQKNGDVREKYANDALAGFGMGNSNPLTTPPGVGMKLDSSQQPSTDVEKEEMKKYPYEVVIGSVICIARCTRPHLAEAMSEPSKFR